MLEEILKYFPWTLKQKIEQININSKIREIRIRAFKNVYIISDSCEIKVEYEATINDLLNILVNISKNSLYAIQGDINNGYVVIPGGHRIGICGEVVITDGKIKNIKNINSMNIRIAHEILGASNKILPYVILPNNSIRNTLIVSPPGCGKTTILRDLIRNLSTGVDKFNFSGKNVGIVDERGEIAAVYQGKMGLNLGERVDVVSNCSKVIGIEMLTRAMGLDIIATDEIGKKEDVEAIRKASLSGLSMIFTVHASSFEDLIMQSQINELIKEKFFTCIVILSSRNGVGTIEDIKILDKGDENINACS